MAKRYRISIEEEIADTEAVSWEITYQQTFDNLLKNLLIVDLNTNVASVDLSNLSADELRAVLDAKDGEWVQVEKL